MIIRGGFRRHRDGRGLPTAGCRSPCWTPPMHRCPPGSGHERVAGRQDGGPRDHVFIRPTRTGHRDLRRRAGDRRCHGGLQVSGGHRGYGRGDPAEHGLRGPVQASRSGNPGHSHRPPVNACSAPSIYAAGDCGRRITDFSDETSIYHWGTHANKQGRVAGVNLSGGNLTFPGVIGTAITKVGTAHVNRTGLSSRRRPGHGLRHRERHRDTL